MNRYHCYLTTLVTVVVLFSAPGYAGSRATQDARFGLEDIAKLSKKVERFAAEQGARVFLIARTGVDKKELPEGVEYTHVGFAVYSPVLLDDGRRIFAYAIHNLYQDDDKLDKSRLTVDFPVDFLSGVTELKVGIVIPTPELQKRLLNVIHSDTYSALHNPSYSVLASPYNSQYQNCTEHVLDVINSAIYQTGDIEQLKRNATEHFKAQVIRVSPLKLLLGSLLSADVKTSDHAGSLQTATFTTIARYLENNGLADSVTKIEFKLDTTTETKGKVL